MTQDETGPGHNYDPLLARQVEAMAGYGVPKEGIALVIGIDRAILDNTLRGRAANGRRQGERQGGRKPLPQGGRRRPAIRSYQRTRAFRSCGCCPLS